MRQTSCQLADERKLRGVFQLGCLLQDFFLGLFKLSNLVAPELMMR